MMHVPNNYSDEKILSINFVFKNNLFDRMTKLQNLMVEHI